MKKNRDISVVKVLLSAALVLSTVEQSSSMDLFGDVCRGDIAGVRSLMSQDEGIKAANFYGQRLIEAAVRSGNTDIVNFLLGYATNVSVTVNTVNPYGQTLLLGAVRSGDIAMATLLIDKGANANKKDSLGQVPLLVAVRSGDIAMATLLIDKGADINAADSHGETPLQVAVLSGDIAMATLLIDKRADINNEGGTLRQASLLLAVKCRNIAMAALLIDKGADISKEDSIFGQTPLQVAVQTGDIAMVTLLVNKGAKVDECGTSRRTPLLTAIHSEKMDMVILLIKLGADIRVENFDFTLLHQAAMTGNKRMISLFTALGLDAGATDMLGCTPMDYVNQLELHHTPLPEDLQISEDLQQRLLECPHQDQRLEMLTTSQLLGNKYWAICASTGDLLSIDPSILLRPIVGL